MATANEYSGRQAPIFVHDHSLRDNPNQTYGGLADPLHITIQLLARRPDLARKPGQELNPDFLRLLCEATRLAIKKGEDALPEILGAIGLKLVHSTEQVAETSPPTVLSQARPTELAVVREAVL